MYHCKFFTIAIFAIGMQSKTPPRVYRFLERGFVYIEVPIGRSIISCYAVSFIRAFHNPQWFKNLPKTCHYMRILTQIYIYKYLSNGTFFYLIPCVFPSKRFDWKNLNQFFFKLHFVKTIIEEKNSSFKSVKNVVFIFQDINPTFS